MTYVNQVELPVIYIVVEFVDFVSDLDKWSSLQNFSLDFFNLVIMNTIICHSFFYFVFLLLRKEKYRHRNLKKKAIIILKDLVSDHNVQCTC